MKILHIYAGNLFGGIETFLISLAKGQNLCPEMESHFALCFEGKLATELLRHQAPVHLLGNVRFSQILSVWRARQALKRLINQENFDVVICHACWSQAIFGSVVKIPSVFWCHDAILGKHWLERIAKFTKPTLAIANSLYTLTFLQNFYPQVPAQVLLCPVYPPEKLLNNSNNRLEIRQSPNLDLDLDLDKVVIIQVSRLERWKGQSLLLQALGELNDLESWECWIVGGAQRPHEEVYLQELLELAQNLGISARVKFLGQRTDVQNLLQAADIHCQPNLGPEPFGISFIEALYAGLPVVTTNMGGGAEIIDSTCGILTEPNNVAELSKSLRALINNQSQRKQLGSNGFARAKQLCDPAQQINRLFAILGAIL